MIAKVIIFDLWETLGTKNIGISNTLKTQFDIEVGSDFIVKYENSIQLQEWKTEKDMAHNFLTSFGIGINEENIQFVVSTLRQGIERATMFDGMKELLIELKGKYKLALLSNTTCFESEVLKRWGIEDLFDTVVFSWQIKSLKPARRNFEEVAQNLKVELSECVFIDDGEKNVNSAKEYGLQVFRFKNIEKLKEYLVAL